MPRYVRRVILGVVLASFAAWGIASVTSHHRGNEPDTSIGINAQIAAAASPQKPAAIGGPYVVIDKSHHKLIIIRDGDRIKEYAIAVGKNKGDKQKIGDMRTPEGTFSVQQIQDASTWTHDFKDGKGQIAGAYGPLFIRLKTPPWRGIGIHGTHDPNSIGTNATEGCIRLNNKELLEFRKLISIGTKVIINP